MNRRAVAEKADVEIVAHQLEVGPPVLVMAALLHLVDARAAVVDGRKAVLDPGREHEGRGRHYASSRSDLKLGFLSLRLDVTREDRFRMRQGASRLQTMRRSGIGEVALLGLPPEKIQELRRGCRYEGLSQNADDAEQPRP